MTDLVQRHWEWEEHKDFEPKHGSDHKPTMYVAGMDIQTVDGARLKHITQVLEDENVHGWRIAALIREMAGLEGEANFESVENKFPFTKCVRQGSVEAPKALAQKGRCRSNGT